VLTWHRRATNRVRTTRRLGPSDRSLLREGRGPGSLQETTRQVSSCAQAGIQWGPSLSVRGAGLLVKLPMNRRWGHGC
jgi:hypothetical protein